METPPVAGKKSLLNSVTKTSLTPCRRPGLGRPSSGSLKKTHLVRTLCSALEKSNGSSLRQENKSNEVFEKNSISLCEDRLTVPLKDTNTHQKARRCLTVSPDIDSKLTPSNQISSEVLKQCNKDNKVPRVIIKKRKLHEDKCVVSKTIHEQSSDFVISKSPYLSGNDVKITTETIEQVAQSIKKKKKILEQLKVQETYAKKHNLVELREQTAKWKTAGQEALRYSLNLAKQAGYSVTLKELISQHGFLPHLIGYNSEDDEFD